MRMEITGAVNAQVAPATDDIVWEVENIARLIGRSRRQTFHLLSTGQLPAKKVGGRWVASRRKLLAAVLGDAA
jgi:hypothetical protein